MFDKGRTIPTGDTELFVADTGKPNGPPIVLLHGGLGSRVDFEPIARLLASEHRLVAIDSRGHGRSLLGEQPMTYRQLAEDVVAILDELDLREAGLLGHSDGGVVALRLAAFGLCQPRFVIAVGAQWHLPDDDEARAIYQAVTAEEWRGMFGSEVARYEAENPRPDFARLFDATRAMWLGRGPDAYPGEAVHTITAPLLVVHGDEDFLVSRKQAFELVERVGGARLLNLPAASHTVLQDSPDDVHVHIARFIKGLSDRPEE